MQDLEYIELMIEELEEQPFPALRACLEDANRVEQDDEEEATDIRVYKRELFKVARLAYILHEAEKIKKLVRFEGIDLLLTSARQYQLCKKKNPEVPPSLDIDATGIPALCLHLLSLPARTNHLTIRTHVFETLPDVLDALKRLLLKFDSDEGYAHMRDYIAQEMPILRNDLEDLSSSLLRDRIEKPLDVNEI